MLHLPLPLSSNLVPLNRSFVPKVRPSVCTLCRCTDIVRTLLSVTDWFFFLILDIGNPAITDIPAGVRVIIGLLQASAVRAAGFATVTLSALAPAVK